MLKVRHDSLVHLPASAAWLGKIGFRGGVLLSSVALASLVGPPAYAATMVRPVSKHAGTAKETVLYTFTGGTTDGAQPYAGVIRDSQGNAYGTTLIGGANDQGTVFKIDKSGETILYTFSGGTDGALPEGALTLDSNGNLYGTTITGGSTAGICSTLFGSGCGVVFELTPGQNNQWTETVLHTFTGESGDGAEPSSSKLLRDAAGDLYGTAEFGGDLKCSDDPARGGCGVVFKLSANGQYTVLRTFHGNDGYLPTSGVVQDARGNLFGTTAYGGTDNAGTVYEVKANGRKKVLHNFTGGTDGGNPTGGQLVLAHGELYGTTQVGGNLSACGGGGCGVVFEISKKSGTQTVLHSFQYGLNGSTDGAVPLGGVVRDASGNIFGTTQDGGTGGYGTVFKLGNAGETVLYNFTGGQDGGFPPEQNLILGSQGTLYGVTQNGGDSECPQGGGCGVVFKVSP